MAFCYSRQILQSISLPIAISRLDPGVWRRLIHFGISRVKPTRRGTRGGRRRSCTPPSSTTFLHRTNKKTCINLIKLTWKAVVNSDKNYVTHVRRISSMQ